jgi:hypothetical protein
VRHTGDGPLKQPTLTEHLGDLRPDPRADLVGTTADRLAGKYEFGQPEDPADGEYGDDRRQAQAYNESDQHLRVHGASPQIRVTGQ